MPESTDSSNTDIEAITIDEVLQTLSRGVIQDDHGLLPWGSNYAYLVSVTDDEHSVLAVYKPQRGERPLWDFPEGTLCYREVAAYLVSQLFGWQIVPPTVLRGGPYGLGSVQFFIHHDPEINYFTPFPAGCQPQLQQFAVFDYVINNADRKGGHCLLDGENHLWGIDHGVSFHHAPKMRTVIWDYAGQPLPDTITRDLVQVCDRMADTESVFNRMITQLISEREILSLRRRLEHLLETKRFVEPDSGPNYPWPPV
jgi:uncharacterized repeat protein (TIGR03843 family)